MTLYSKPSVRSSWGQTATPSDTQDPGDTYASKGWQIGIKPPRQYFNWVLNYIFAGVRYLCQVGVATWDAAEQYAPGALVVNTQDGLLYRTYGGASPQGQRPDQSLFSSWDIPYVPTAPAGDRTARAANTGWVGSYFMPVNSPFNFLSGQILNAQVGVGAVTQWQGSLSIGGSQITSAVARANTVFNTSGQYATFNWSGQSGQPSWLWGSNDGLNFYVWNPSNFNVANANTVAGLSVSIAASGSTVMARDSGGYAYAQYFNQASGNNENPSINQFMVTNGGDNFLRKASVASVVAGLQATSGWLTSGNFGASLGTNGFQRLANGAILQWGTAAVSNGTFVSFPLTFPSRSCSVVFTNISTTNQIFLNGQPSAATGFSVANGSGTISWFATGF